MYKVYKYGTGQEIPEGAVYLSTQVETVAKTNQELLVTTNLFVWHYFLVKV